MGGNRIRIEPRSPSKGVGCFPHSFQLDRSVAQVIIRLQYPLAEVVVIQRDVQFLEDVKSLESYLLHEVNVRKLTLSDEKEKWGVKLKAEPNFRALGARLKADQKKVADYLKVCLEYVNA